jgi:hypothetical protein
MPLVPIRMFSAREPFRLHLPNTSQSSVQMAAVAHVVFLDDGTERYYSPLTPYSAVPRSIYDGATTIDGTSDNWLLLASKGAAWPVWVKERDLSTIETLLGGHGWAPLRMLANGKLNPLFLQDASGLPDGDDGTLLYKDPTTHQWIAVGGAQGDSWRFDDGMWQRAPIGNLGDVWHVAMGPSGPRGEWEALDDFVIQLSPLLPDTGPVGSGTGAGNKVLGLWNGSGNNGEPSGWRETAFNDSSWPAPVQSASIIADGMVPFPGTTPIWRNDPATTGEICLFRLTFNPGSGSIASARFQFQEDDQSFGIWLNGHQIFAGGGPVEGDVTADISIPGSLFISNAKNVIALSGKNIYPPHAGINYVLTINGS